MANQSAKKRLESNAARLRNLQILIFAVNMVHVVVRFYLKSSSLWWFNYLAFALTSVCYAVCYRALHLAGEPFFSSSGELVDGGTDLGMPGACEYYHDAMYIAGIFQIITLATDRLWLLVLLAPAYLAYLLWSLVIAPWIFTPTQEEMEANEKHRQRKLAQEKRANRRRR